MAKRILIVQGHPDSTKQHLCHALADAYAKGAGAAGMQVNTVNVTTLDFPLLRSAEEWNNNQIPDALLDAQQAILDADHILFVYPLWLGTMPAVLKAFLEQVFRPKMGKKQVNDFMLWRKLLKGTSARIVVTMGMPAFFYRWFYRAHSVKSLQRNILAFTGIKPVRTTLIGMVDNIKPERAERLFHKMEKLGASGG